MRFTRGNAICLTVMLALAGCRSRGVPERVPDPAPAEAVDVTFSMSGGVAGINERLEVSKEGALTL